MKSYFKEFFEYNACFNQRLSAVFIENPGLADGRSHRLFSHILNAHHIWNHRVMIKQSKYSVWGLLSTSSMEIINAQNLDESMYVLKHLDLNKVISYQHSKGQAFQNKISDILFHIINHSTYHRGQIATDLRENGIEPLLTDYIFWKRKSQNEY